MARNDVEVTKAQFISEIHEHIMALSEALQEAAQYAATMQDYNHRRVISDIEPRERPSILFESINAAYMKTYEALNAVADLDRLLLFVREFPDD